MTATNRMIREIRQYQEINGAKPKEVFIRHNEVRGIAEYIRQTTWNKDDWTIDAIIGMIRGERLFLLGVKVCVRG